jgi:hypothetical protein
VDALAKGVTYDAISTALPSKETQLEQLKERRREAAPVTIVFPATTEAEVRQRLDQIWNDLQDADRDRARLDLGRIFESLIVKPLNGSWSNGWLLEMNSRPQALVQPEDGRVAQLVGCGGRI